MEREDELLTQFLKSVVQARQIDTVYTASAHKQLILRQMNETVCEHPEWSQMIAMLAVHPVQVWAAGTRKKLDMDVQSVMQMVSGQYAYFGFRKAYAADAQIAALTATDRAMLLLDDDISGESKKFSRKYVSILNGAHGTGADFSKYMCRVQYKPALEKICAADYRKINRIMAPVESCIAELGTDSEFVYHDADLLIKLGKVMHDERRRWASSIDYEIMCNSIDRCIKGLACYPYNGRELSTIASVMFHGGSEFSAASAIGKSRGYAHARYSDAVEALGYLLWGYTTPQILSMAAESNQQAGEK